VTPDWLGWKTWALAWVLQDLVEPGWVRAGKSGTSGWQT